MVYDLSNLRRISKDTMKLKRSKKKEKRKVKPINDTESKWSEKKTIQFRQQSG